MTRKGEIDSSGEYLRLTYRSGTFFVLFYYFDNFRRAYIATTASDGDTVYSLPGISAPVKIILCAKGRKVDYLKRCIYTLTKDDEYAVFRFPAIFWYKLAGIIQYKEAKKSDLLLLKKIYENEDQNENNP